MFDTPNLGLGFYVPIGRAWSPPPNNLYGVEYMSTKSHENNRPTHAIWQVIGIGDRARWQRIGSAWLHNDKKGANMKFDSFPMGGRVVVRELSDANAVTAEAMEGAA